MGGLRLFLMFRHCNFVFCFSASFFSFDKLARLSAAE